MQTRVSPRCRIGIVTDARPVISNWDTFNKIRRDLVKAAA